MKLLFWPFATTWGRGLLCFAPQLVAAFKESMTLNLAQRSFKVIDFDNLVPIESAYIGLHIPISGQ